MPEERASRASRCHVTIPFLLVIGLPMPVAEAAGTDWRTSTFFVFSTGYEETPIFLSVDPPPSDAGGAFMDGSAGVLVKAELGTRLQLLAGARSTLERFANSHDRTLQGHLVWTELAYASRDALRLRGGVAGDYFDDSFLDGLERYGLAGEVAVGLVGRSWEGEIVAGARGTHYPSALLSESGTRVPSYEALEVSGGMRIAGSPAGRVALRAGLFRQWTDVGASLPDVDSWVITADVEAGVGSRLHVDGMAMVQPRTLVEGDGGVGDDYVQCGVGAGLLLRSRTGMHLRWSGARYTSPEGSERETQRVELSLELGGFTAVRRPGARVPWDPWPWGDVPGTAERPREETGVHFRLIAPEAESVAVSGDFNGWSRGTHRLESTGDGVWQLTVEIPPGDYQYVYLVDGNAWTPPEAVVTFEDGFGGRNGLLEVGP